jgi:hypothetical protein
MSDEIEPSPKSQLSARYGWLVEILGGAGIWGGAAIAGGGSGVGIGAAAAAGAASVAFSHLIRRRLHFADEVAAALPVEQLPGELLARPQLFDLFREAYDAASRTEWAAKRVLLARAIARGFQDDTRISFERYLVQAARAVEPPEARLLLRLESLPEPEAPADRIHSTEPSILREDLRNQLGEAGDTPALDPQMGTLLREGLIRDVTGTWAGPSTWGLSPFGKLFLGWLRDAEPGLTSVGTDEA